MFDSNDDLGCRGMHRGRNYIEEIKQLKLYIDKLKATILKLERDKQLNVKKVG